MQTDPRAYANADANGYQRAYSYTDEHLDANPDAIAHAHPDSNCHCHTDGHAHSHLDADPDPLAHTDSFGDADPDPAAASHLDADTGLCPAYRDSGSRGQGAVGARHARRQRHARSQPGL